MMLPAAAARMSARSLRSLRLPVRSPARPSSLPLRVSCLSSSRVLGAAVSGSGGGGGGTGEVVIEGDKHDGGGFRWQEALLKLSGFYG